MRDGIVFLHGFSPSMEAFLLKETPEKKGNLPGLLNWFPDGLQRQRENPIKKS
jgi:hypothetical protein